MSRIKVGFKMHALWIPTRAGVKPRLNQLARIFCLVSGRPQDTFIVAEVPKSSFVRARLQLFSQIARRNLWGPCEPKKTRRVAKTTRTSGAATWNPLPQRFDALLRVVDDSFAISYIPLLFLQQIRDAFYFQWIFRVWGRNNRGRQTLWRKPSNSCRRARKRMFLLVWW